jgi:hypothetical protein
VFFGVDSIFKVQGSPPIRSFIGILQPLVDLRFAGLANRYIFAASNYQLPVKILSHGTTRK